MNAATREFVRSNLALKDVEILAAIESDLRLARNIDLKELGDFLIKSNIDEQLDATQVFLEAKQSDSPLLPGLRKLHRFLSWNLATVGTASQDVGAAVLQIVLGLEQLQAQVGDPAVGISSAQAEEVVASLGGGYLLDRDLTEADVADERARVAGDVTATELRVRLADGVARALAAVTAFEQLNAELPQEAAKVTPKYSDLVTAVASVG